MLPSLEDDRDALARIEATPDLTRSDGRVVVFGSLPDAYGDLDAFATGGTGTDPTVAPTYAIAVGTEAFSEESVDLGVPGGISFFLSAASTSQERLDEIRSFYDARGNETVSIGWATAWIGEDVTAGCGPAPEDGYSSSVLTWDDGGIVYSIHASPVPECEVSPVSLDEVVQVATDMIACRGFDATVDCVALAPDEG